MKHDYYEAPNLNDKIAKAAESFCLHSSASSQLAGISGKRWDMLQSSGSSGSGSDNMPEKVAKLESNVAHIKRDVDELKTDVKAIDKNMITILARLDSIKESLTNKPSSDAVDRKISDAKLAVLLGVPAIIAAGTGLYKLSMYFFFSA
ncbi:hypothetical protein [Escherichia coli]|uniref:hypothetical protein n=1 Tax=Escherichia coli TaxID=562 RepID=UPI001FF16EBA|nr:hypothetical protein [Escherichia coli]MCL7905133.1 hypothetical protein [Escherichia coli]MCL7914820.1 hypothetical protein [Escherichia coli]MDC7892149.1 hypothetical protein [Escherichia coli]MDT8590218.1 hypothetical protein [Escherichia coli]MDZ9056365.1 hypothetical protein [Escherichia coli]